MSHVIEKEQDGVFSSADFNRVSQSIKTIIPKKLIHKNVIDKDDQATQVFSNERNHPVKIVDLPSKTLSMTIGLLYPNTQTRRHRHNYETIIYVIEGAGVSIIEDQKVEWQAGDAFYVPIWAWHHHINLGKNTCTYVACENAPLLQNLGNIGLREESE